LFGDSAVLAFYLLAIVSLLVGTAAIYMALIEPFPVSWLYWHYFIRKPIVWTILAGTLAWGLLQPQFPLALIGPLMLMALGVVLTYRMHQSVVFHAIDFPAEADAEDLPLRDEMEIAVVDYGGVTRAYALDHLIHHHIINDRFGDSIVAVTYCAMCRSIIPFDVTEIGPLFVGSYKNANMIVADRKTKTFFQQATFKSVIGKLHPMELTMVPYQILTWGELKASGHVPKFCRFTTRDLRPFELPVHGLWTRIMSSEVTPGFARVRHDTSLPARTHVVGLREPGLPPIAFKRDDVRTKGVVLLPELGIALVSAGGGVNGFSIRSDKAPLDLELTADNTIRDKTSGSTWNLRGIPIAGELAESLRPIRVSDEYWFSWKLFHPKATLETA